MGTFGRPDGQRDADMRPNSADLPWTSFCPHLAYGGVFVALPGKVPELSVRALINLWMNERTIARVLLPLLFPLRLFLLSCKSFRTCLAVRTNPSNI